MASPLPKQEGILHCVASKHYMSLMNLKDCFEQIWIIPEHIPHIAITTPDGNMVSLMVQQGDCNAPAICQALMNHLFGVYLGIWMDVYLDDISIYNDGLDKHIEHVQIVVDIPKRSFTLVNGISISL